MATSDSIEKETTFTPGPYEDHNESSFAGGVSYRTIVAAARNDRAGDYWKTICLLPHFDDPQTIANARLIAAATELYEALQSCVTQMRVWVAINGDLIGALQQNIDAAESALAKARGEDRSHEGK